MEPSQIDVVADNECSIREECEDIVSFENVYSAPSGFFVSKFRGIMEWMASRPWGQMIFKSLDRVLWCCERTLIWQNPDKLSLVPMARPVNALLAYPLAAFLWILQHLMFSTAESSSAIELIKWVQIRRRRLRAIRFHGIRNMRGKNVLESPSGLKLQIAEVDEKNDREEGIIEESEHTKKRRFSALSAGADLSLDEYNSESDSDYVPECSLSSESYDSDSSSVEDDETEEGNPNESVREPELTNERADPQNMTNGHDPLPTV